MSYLYSTFAQLVSVHCKATAATASIPVNQCKRDLLNYGYEKLQTFSDSQLDNFDPYQRGANELIWSSIMRNHPSSVLITTRKPLTSASGTTLLVLNDENFQKDNTNAADTDTSETQHIKNPIFETDNEQQHQYAMDMDIAYGYPSMSHNPQVDVFDSSAHSNPSEEEKHRTYLTGPSVVRVRPDGTPVEEDRHKPLPQDDDLEVLNSSSSSAASTSTFSSSIPNYSYTGTTKHRKIATISALKQQYLNSLALQQQKLLPIYRQTGERRHMVV